MGEIIDKTKGKIKQAAGALIGNESLKREGEQDELKGQAEGVIEDVKDAVKDAKDAVVDAVKQANQSVKDAAP